LKKIIAQETTEKKSSIKRTSFTTKPALAINAKTLPSKPLYRLALTITEKSSNDSIIFRSGEKAYDAISVLRHGFAVARRVFLSSSCGNHAQKMLNYAKIKGNLSTEREPCQAIIASQPSFRGAEPLSI
jgi:hypothetical protein